MNLDSQATAFWLIGPVGDSKSFESLRNAIRFVMEDLKEPLRGTAYIDPDDGSAHYEIAEIREIYASDEYKTAR